MTNIIETSRLLLRPTRQEDLDGFAEFHADEKAMTFLGGKTISRPEAFRSMCTYAGSWSLTGISMFSVIEKASGQWIGRIGPWMPEDWPGTEVGWGILSRFEGKGYATEAAAASMDYAVDVLGWTNIIHTIVPENLPSIALAKRLGSRKLGPTQLPQPYDHFIIDAWGQSADEWRANRDQFA